MAVQPCHSQAGPLKAYPRFLFAGRGGARFSPGLCRGRKVQVRVYRRPYLPHRYDRQRFDVHGGMVGIGAGSPRIDAGAPGRPPWGILIFTIDRFMVSSLRTDAV